MKKLLALVLAAIMMMALASTASAEVDMSAYNATVSVGGIAEGNTLKLYKICDVQIGDNNVMNYSFNTSLPEAYNTMEEITAESVDVTALANAIGGVFGGTTPTYTGLAGSDKTATITDVAPGWYYAIVSGTADTSIIYKNMLINTIPQPDSGSTWKKTDVTVAEAKHETEDVTKATGKTPDHTAEVDNTTEYSVGEDVPFEIKTTIPNYPADSKVATFVITDTPTHLTDKVATVKVTVAGDEGTGTTTGTISGKFTVAENSKGFTITFSKDYILAHAGAAVTVKYDATIDADAEIKVDGETATNTAKITFNPNPHETTEVEPDDTTKVYTKGVYVIKHKEGSEETRLPGAKFKLYKILDDSTEVQVGNEQTTDGNGNVSWNGLGIGNYKLVETAAPAGYTLPSDPTTSFSITADENKDNPMTISITEANYKEVKISNSEGKELPSTGGIGTTIFYAAGLVLVLGAAAILISRRKAEAED